MLILVIWGLGVKSYLRGEILVYFNYNLVLSWYCKYISLGWFRSNIQTVASHK